MRTYTRKTDRGSYSKEDIVRAVDLVKKNEASIRSAAKMCGINCRTLSRYCKRLTGDDALEEISGESLFTVGYKSGRQVFPNALEEELVEYILTASSIYQGLSPKEIRKLAYQLAIANGLPRAYRCQMGRKQTSWR